MNDPASLLPPGYALQQLYGGAIQTHLPHGLVDVSDLRQVPDTQEVFISKTTDVSYIFDVTQAVEPQEPQAAIQFHFEALADDNAASSYQILAVTPATSPDGPSVLYGRQSAAKYRKGADEADLVDVYLALWRIPAKKADFVFTMNVPRGKAADVDVATLGERVEEKAQFEQVVRSLRILDLGLFA